MRHLLSTATVALLAASCSSLWDRANRLPFQEDIAEVLSASGSEAVLTDCHMEGNTRTGYCLLDADLPQVEAITASLGMGEPRAVEIGDSPAIPVFLRDSPCIAHYPSDAFDEVLAYFIAGRPDPLRLADGGQFEYTLITVDPTKNDVCVQASYAYG